MMHNVKIKVSASFVLGFVLALGIVYIVTNEGGLKPQANHFNGSKNPVINMPDTNVSSLAPTVTGNILAAVRVESVEDEGKIIHVTASNGLAPLQGQASSLRKVLVPDSTKIYRLTRKSQDIILKELTENQKKIEEGDPSVKNAGAIVNSPPPSPFMKEEVERSALSPGQTVSITGTVEDQSHIAEVIEILEEISPAIINQ